MRRSIPKILGVLALVAVASVAGFFSSLSGENQPIIDVPQKSLDLGTVLVQNDMRWTLPMTNMTRQPIAVGRLKASCACTGISPHSFAIPVGGTVNVALRLDLSPPALRGKNRPKWTPSEWPFSVTLAADIIGQPRMAWELRGAVRSPLVFSATKLTIGPGSIVSLADCTVVTAKPERNTSLVIRAVKPVKSVEVTCATKVATGRLTRGSGDNSGDFLLRIEPDELVPPGRHAFDAVVTVVTEDGRQASVRIPVIMYVDDDLTVSPPTVVFDHSGPRGSLATAEVTLASRLEEPFIVESSHVDDGVAGDAHVQVTKMGDSGPRDEHRLRVTLRSEKSGYREHRVQLRCFYPAKRLSTHREFIVVEMTGSPKA